MGNQFYLTLVRLISIILVSICMIFIIKYTFMYIYPFLIAIIIAFLLNPLVTMFETKWKMNRTVATSFIMMIFFSIFILICFFTLKRLLIESTSLIQTLPNQFSNIKKVLIEIGQTYIVPYYEKLTDTIPLIPSFDQLEFNNYLELIVDQLGSSSMFFIKNIAGSTSAFFSSITYVGTILIFILLAVFIITKDFKLFQNKLIKITPEKVSRKSRQMITYLKASVFGFIKAQIIITVISSIIVMIGLFIFQIDNILMITLTVFVVDFIPYLGVGAIFIPWIIYSFFTEQFFFTIQLSGLYIVIIIIRQLIEPRILASSIGIHPLVALIILFFGIQSLGLIGIFITPVVLIVVSAIYHAGILHFIWNYIVHG